MRAFISPLRISFVGGGTDMPFYYKKKDGAVISTSINKYTWVFVNELKNKKLLLKYSKSELVKHKKLIKHRLIKEILKDYKYKGYEISFFGDLPNRSGLASSSSFSVALIAALEKIQKNKMNKEILARKACDVEIRKLKDPIGKQDQYISSYGGLRHIIFKKNRVLVKKIKIKKNILIKFQNSISLINTGFFRSARKILKKQSKKANQNMHIYNQINSLVPKFLQSLKDGNLKLCGKILSKNWELKKKLDKNIYLNNFKNIEKKLESMNVYGYKLLGAGSGGYYCIISNLKTKKKIKKMFGNKFVDIKFDKLGAREIKIIV